MSAKKQNEKARATGKNEAATPKARGSAATSAAENRRVQRVMAERRARRNKLLLKLGGAAAIAVLAVVALIVINNARDEGATSALVIPTPSAIEVQTDGRTKGDPNAPVKIIEWGDYQCPACSAFTRTVEPQLVADYVADGKVFVEYRDMAFLGKESTDASKAAVCANEQGKFWEFHTMLYYNQGEHKNAGAFSRSRLNEMARAQGLDEQQFGTCFSSDSTRAEVERMYNDARANGIDSTPSFLINGTRVSGANYAPIRDAIEAALAAQ